MFWASVSWLCFKLSFSLFGHTRDTSVTYKKANYVYFIDVQKQKMKFTFIQINMNVSRYTLFNSQRFNSTVYVVFMWWYNALVRKSKKEGNIRNRYSQLPHLTQDNIWESENITHKRAKELQQVTTGLQGTDCKTVASLEASLRAKQCWVNSKVYTKG